MATSVKNPEAASGVSSNGWTWFRVGGYCILTFTYQATGVAIDTSTSGQYQSAEIDTEMYLPSWVKSVIAVSGSAGQGSQGGGTRLHRVMLWSINDSVKFVLARPQSAASESFPFTVIVFGTC